MRRLDISRARRGRREAAIKKADTEPVQIKGPQRKKKSDNKEIGCRGYTDQGPAKG